MPTVGTYFLPGGWWTDLLQASARAGFIGGVADWFAVTALFRHPLGLAIPHTAIIPNQKERLGQALGRFVSRHVFTEAEVARILARIDLVGILHIFLADPDTARPAAEALAGSLPKILASIEDGRARRLIARILPRAMGGPAAGFVVARALRALMASGRHQDAFGFMLAQLKTTLAAKEWELQRAIEARVREQGGRLLGWALGANIAKRTLAVLNAELDAISPDGSELRAAFDEYLGREIARMEYDPHRAAEIGAAIRAVVGHETVQAWIWDIWSRLRAALEADAARPDGRTVAYLETALGNLGSMLEADPAARARIERAAQKIIVGLIPAAQGHLSDLIAQVITGWDTATIVDRIELRVGRDLQMSA